jgi:hypothetical protein
MQRGRLLRRAATPKGAAKERIVPVSAGVEVPAVVERQRERLRVLQQVRRRAQVAGVRAG